MKGVLIGIAILLASVLLLAGGFLAWGYIYGLNYEYDAPEHVELVANKYNTVTAVGNGLYDENGDRFDIKGINYGNLFVTEGWMTVNSMGALLNSDGTYAKVNEEGIVEEYEEIYQEEMDKALSRFTNEQIESLYDAFFNSYCTEADFKLISDMGMNTIRLPMYYRNFLTTEYRYRLDTNGDDVDDTDEILCAMNFEDIELVFDKLDKFLEYAKAYDLKVIIDMHGVMGGQSGYEHSGTRDIDFWDNEDYIEFMCNLWKAIAEHYVNDRPDLASTILAYDLANEPTNRNEVGTGPEQWAVMDKMYQAIRSVDEHHVISIEGVWFPVSLPSTEKYGWENVLYQCHYYNWSGTGVSNQTFYSFIFGLASLVESHDVPLLVGEFNLFGDYDEWLKYLNQYDKMGWGWTIWSYKIISVGWWDNSWGLAVNKMDLKNGSPDELYATPEDERNLKLDLRTATYEEIYEMWSNEYTEYNGQEGKYKLYEDGVTYRALKQYFEDLKNK